VSLLEAPDSKNGTSGERLESCTSGWHCTPIYRGRTMIVRFFDLEDDANPLNGSVVADEESLARLLDDLRSREPFVAELRSDNGYVLSMGIGYRVGYVQYSSADGEPPYLEAIAAAPTHLKRMPTFLCGGTPSPVPRRAVLPFEEAQKIAMYFLRTGQRSPAVSWGQVGGW